jgi:hypothetical protein
LNLILRQVHCRRVFGLEIVALRARMPCGMWFESASITSRPTGGLKRSSPLANRPSGVMPFRDATALSSCTLLLLRPLHVSVGSRDCANGVRETVNSRLILGKAAGRTLTTCDRSFTSRNGASPMIAISNRAPSGRSSSRVGCSLKNSTRCYFSLARPKVLLGTVDTSPSKKLEETIVTLFQGR